MLKNAYFWKKLKIASSSKAEPPNSRLPPAAGGSARIFLARILRQNILPEYTGGARIFLAAERRVP